MGSSREKHRAVGSHRSQWGAAERSTELQGATGLSGEQQREAQSCREPQVSVGSSREKHRAAGSHKTTSGQTRISVDRNTQDNKSIAEKDHRGIFKGRKCFNTNYPPSPSQQQPDVGEVGNDVAYLFSLPAVP